MTNISLSSPGLGQYDFMKNFEALIKKYNKAGPRYTSYPPVPFWHNGPDENQWIEHIKMTYNPATGLDLYLHIPYCEQLCFYCGCNRTITKNHNVEEPLTAAIIKEWQIIKNRLGFSPKVNSIHLGGGTPTFLSPENLQKLFAALLENKSAAFFGSVELDPRTCRHDHLAVFGEFGINRLSMGIQDFDPAVQEAINRKQSVDLVQSLVEKIRSEGFSSINFDLIYGLPKQTKETINKTIEEVIKLSPDLIAFYSYAHLPEKIKNQKLINNNDLPGPELKKQLYEHGKDLLTKCGYVEIGMDHFAKEENYLAQAMKNKSMQRSFMGFTDKKTNILIGLGPSSISETELSYVQNKKDIKAYTDTIEKGLMAIETGHTHSPADKVAAEIIHNLMCNGEFKFNPAHFELTTRDRIQRELKEFLDDQILLEKDDKFVVTDTGRGFVRNVAMIFDHYLQKQGATPRFSQTI